MTMVTARPTPTDMEDLDLAALEDEFIMGKAYVDSKANEGKTRDEIMRAGVHNTNFIEAQEEVFHNAVPDPKLKTLLVSGSALCFTATPGEKPVYGDEQCHV